MPPMPAFSSILSSGLGAAVGSLFSSTAPPDANKAQKGSGETNDAARATYTSRPSRATATEQDLRNRYRDPSRESINRRILIRPTSPSETNIRERRRDFRSPDERRLTGDYGTPADAVIIKPPATRAPMARSKPYSGAYGPVNTLGHAGRFERRPRGRPETYGTKRRSVGRLDSLRFPESRGESVIGREDTYGVVEGELSPHKRRKTQGAKNTLPPSSVIDLEPDDPSPSEARHRGRTSETAPSTTQSSFRPHSQNSSGRRASSNSFALNEFRTVNETVDPRRRKQKQFQNLPSSHNSTPPTHALSNTFSTSQRCNKTGNAAPAIQVSDDDAIPQHVTLTRSSDVMEPLQRFPTSALPPSPRHVSQDHESKLKSKYFPTKPKDVPHEEDDIVEVQDSFSPSTIYRGMKRGIQSERSRSPQLRRKFRRTEDLDSSIDELQQPEDSSACRSTKTNKLPSNNTQPANPAVRRNQGKDRNSGWLMELVRTHGKKFVGSMLTLKYDEETESFHVRLYDINSSYHVVKDRIHLEKITRVFKQDESYRVRVMGSRANNLIYTYDLEFTDRKDYDRFLLYINKPGIAIYPRSNAEMDILFSQKLEVEPSRKTLDSLNVYDDAVDELALQAHTQRKADYKPQSLQTTGGASAQHQRQNSLISKLRASIPEDMPERRLPTLKQDAEEERPSTGRLRNTRLNNTIEKARMVSNQRRSPSPLESIRYSVDPGLGPKWDQPVIYPPTGRRRAHVDFDDLLRLDDGEFLNDNLIDFYMNWAYNRANLPSNKVYFFNTYFYSSLWKSQKGQRGINYSAVQRWTAKEDIFNYDYVVVPINEDAHWYIAIICNLTNIDRILHKEPSLEAPTRSSPNRVGEDDKDPEIIVDSSDESKRKGKEDSAHKSIDLDTINDSLDQDEPEDLSLIQHEMNLIRGVPQAEYKEQIKYEDDEEWPDSQENGRSHAASPFQEIVAMRNLSIQEESAGGLLASPTPKSNLGGKKKLRRKSAPGLKKYDPDEPIIVVLDSLGLTHPRTVRHLKDYVFEEGKAKRNIDAIIEKSMNPKEIPLQNNFCDCGLFLLGYLDKFFVNPREFITKILTREMNVEIDWPDLDPKHMRNYIRDLLFKLAKEQQVERQKLELERRGKRKKKILSGKKQSEEEILKQTAPQLSKQHSPSQPPVSPQVITQKQQTKAEPTEPEVALSVEYGVKARLRSKSPLDSNDHRLETHRGISEELVEVEDSQSQAKALHPNSLLPVPHTGSSEELIEIADSQPSSTTANSRLNGSQPLENKSESEEAADSGFLRESLFEQLERSAGYSAEGPKPRRERRVIDVDAHEIAENEGANQLSSLANPLSSSRRRPAEDLQRPPTRGKTC